MHSPQHAATAAEIRCPGSCPIPHALPVRSLQRARRLAAVARRADYALPPELHTQPCLGLAAEARTLLGQHLGRATYPLRVLEAGLPVGCLKLLKPATERP